MRTWNRPLVAPLNRVASVANALGEDLRAAVVFIGGAVLPLLQEEGDLLGSARPTKDVDGVVATTNYTQKARIEDALRERKFRNQMNASHMDRWLTPDGAIFDLVACGTKMPLESKDLSDIVTLVATRPSIVDEVHSAPELIRDFLLTQVHAILADKRTMSSIATHLRDNDPLVDDLETRVLDRLGAL